MVLNYILVGCPWIMLKKEKVEKKKKKNSIDAEEKTMKDWW